MCLSHVSRYRPGADNLFRLLTLRYESEDVRPSAAELEQAAIIDPEVEDSLSVSAPCADGDDTAVEEISEKEPGQEEGILEWDVSCFRCA